MTSRIYSPPWRELQPNGHLGAEYGPKSAAAYARQVERFKDWSYRAQRKRICDAELICAFMVTEPEGLPESEREAFSAVFERGLSVRAAASDQGVSRSSVRCYLGRLRVRAKIWANSENG